MKKWYRLSLLLLLIACTPEPKPIDYGLVPCSFCKMTIVDRQHAAEAVTKKGRVYQFDAIECMINYLDQAGNDGDYAFLLVNDYAAPGELVDARTSTFLISPQLPSPMGAFLSAFAGETAAREMQVAKGGDLYDWTTLRAHFKQEQIRN